jgi:hypothetical protein
MNHITTQSYKKQLGHNLEEELKALNASYLEGTIEEMLPTTTVTMGASNPNDNMEGSLNNHGVNTTYWYHFQWWGNGSQAKSSNEEENEFVFLVLKENKKSRHQESNRCHFLIKICY